MKSKNIIYPSLLFTLIIIIWELSVRISNVPNYILPSPTKLTSFFLTYISTGELLINAWVTLQEIFIGTFFGIILGVFLGYLIVKIKLIERLLMPLILIIQIAPKISLAPLFILWFGLGIQSKIALVILVVSFPIMVNQYTAFKQIDIRYIELLKILKASKFQKFISLELPFAFSAIISGIKVSMTQAITAAVIGEMMGAKSGLGYLLTYGNEMYDINIILSSVITLSIIGLVLYYMATYIEKKVLYWR
ncbi:ABC transporter permease [Enterococcus gallinarum]|uniref:ABC transporter permease n=1 Tax=Enterococcus gallinarum TaxID=1353 RepID=UPI002953D49C|nr:ABC transporter permease [Enterococcus gallinarum]MDV7824465.1 ABC transporter permease [Enterococcus gallinarum]